ncbi:MAG: flagellar biosynthetic protein FliO [Steroidobacteraceae bacterium]
MSTKSTIFAIAASALSLQSVAAESPLFAAPKATAVPATGAGSFVQVTIALAIVLAAVFAAAWLMQRLRSFGGGQAGSIKVITSVALGAKERAVVVQVGRQQLLLGVAPGRVTTLHVLAEPLNGQESVTSTAVPSGQPDAPNFKSLLRKSLGLS